MGKLSFLTPIAAVGCRLLRVATCLWGQSSQRLAAARPTWDMGEAPGLLTYPAPRGPHASILVVTQMKFLPGKCNEHSGGAYEEQARSAFIDTSTLRRAC